MLLFYHFKHSWQSVIVVTFHTVHIIPCDERLWSIAFISVHCGVILPLQLCSTKTSESLSLPAGFLQQLCLETFPVLSPCRLEMSHLSYFWFLSFTGMNGKSILSAIGRHTPEHPAGVMPGSGATTSPCSSRSSSQRSGTGGHTPHLSPKPSAGSSCNALVPSKSTNSPRLSPG